MERIELDSEYGLLTVSYPYNGWKQQRLQPLKLRYNSSSERWETSIGRAKEVIAHIKAVGAYVRLSPRIQDIVGLGEFGSTQEEIDFDVEKWSNHLSFSSVADEAFDEKSIGFTKSTTPYGFQLSGVAQAVGKHGRILLADDMGLGKTLQAIGTVGALRRYMPALAIVPKSVLYHWKCEFLRFLDFIDEDDICILDHSSKKAGQMISICTYRYAVTHTEELKEYLNVEGILIADEAHTAKDGDNQVGTMLRDLAHFSKCYLPLTGTPILNHIKDLFSLLNGLDPVRWNDYLAFTERYCEGHFRKIRLAGRGETTIWWDLGASNVEELMGILRDGYMVRRLKTDVLDQLPPKHRVTQTLNITSKDAAFDEFMENLRAIAEPILIKNNFSVSKSADEVRHQIGISNNEFSEEDLEAMPDPARRANDSIFKLYEDSGLAKVDNVIESVLDMLEADPDNKFILFFQHRSVLDAFKSTMRARVPQYSDIVIHGDVSAEKREEAKIEYQSNSNCKFAYATIGAGYAGITLTAGNIVGMVQFPWSPKVAEQCEDRAWRLTQERDVLAIYFIGANKFETAQHKLLWRKSDASVSALDGVMGKRFDSNDSDDLPAFNSKDAFIALLEVVAEEVREDLENNLS